MPILTELSDEKDWVEPDDVPRPVVTYGFIAEDFGGLELDLHRHAKGQILLVQRGALSCEIEGGLWIVPPRSAVWIPGGAMHAIKVSGTLEGYGAFIAPAFSTGLPRACCAIAVTPLLRELLTRAASLPLFYEEHEVNGRLLSVLLDELSTAEIEDLHLPMPTDVRLRRIVNDLMARPADRGTIHIWSRRAGLSERTLARLIRTETGMSFGRWRQHLAVMLAVKWLADGASIQKVASDLGYESVPGFVTMFRKALGTSPGRYMAERYTNRS